MVFEGAGGSGTTTQVSYAKELLLRNGYEVVATREPGGVRSAELIRNFIFRLKKEKLIGPKEQMALFFGSRVILHNKVINPALKEGKIVLSDRYSPSTNAYQGWVREEIKNRY